MPGKVKVRILSGRNLPVMDRSSDTTDAFCEVRLGLTTFKTDVCRKSLNPVWNSEWFRFDVDDLELQDEPLTIRIMDYDTYSANDAIGKVYIDLNPLLWPSSPSTTKKDSTDGSSKEDKPPGGMMCGWLPIFDTMNGVRGEVNVQVKVELFSDLNRFRQSSCGVQFFRTSGIPEGYRVQFINGFVEELVMNDDPEYQWIDKIRTPRASNEARQTLFLKLSGIIQRKIGLKALELGGNAVLGYQQKFDLESDNIVVRGIGTAVTLSTTTLYRDIPIKDKYGGSTGRGDPKSFFKISEEVKPIVSANPHDPFVEITPEHPVTGILVPLALAAAVVKVPKPIDPTPAKPWYRKTSFREAAQSFKSGMSSKNSSRKNSLRGSAESPLLHHRVSSLKVTATASETNMLNANSQSAPIILTVKQSAVQFTSSSKSSKLVGKEDKTEYKSLKGDSSLAKIGQKSHEKLKSLFYDDKIKEQNTQKEYLDSPKIKTKSEETPKTRYRSKSPFDRKRTECTTKVFVSVKDHYKNISPVMAEKVKHNKKDVEHVSQSSFSPQKTWVKNRSDTVSAAIKDEDNLNILTNPLVQSHIEQGESVQTSSDCIVEKQFQSLLIKETNVVTVTEDMIAIKDVDATLQNKFWTTPGGPFNTQQPQIKIFCADMKDQLKRSAKLTDTERPRFEFGEGEGDEYLSDDNYSVNTLNEDWDVAKELGKENQVSESENDDSLCLENEWPGSSRANVEGQKRRVGNLRHDSEGQCQMTLINTLLNKNMHLTSEGDAIRKQLATGEQGKGIENVGKAFNATSKADYCDIKRENSSASLRRVSITDFRPILTIDPPSPLINSETTSPPPSPPICLDRTGTNDDNHPASQALVPETITYECKCNNSLNHGPLTNIDPNIPTFAGGKTAAKTQCCLTPNTNKVKADNNSVFDCNKLTVPHAFDSVPHLILDRLSARERKACQRSNSVASGVVSRLAHETSTDPGGKDCSVRCASLSPAHSFRDRALNTRFAHPFAKNPKCTNTISTSTLSYGFRRSHGVDLGGKPDVGDGLQRGGEYDRPSPDQDLGCSPRGYNLMHVTSEKQFGVHKYSNRVGITQESLELLECPFITLKRLPKGFIHRFGGYVSCRSVKLLEGLQEDDDTRDIWWQDTRREVRSHARSLGCNIIVGYTEDTVICEDIIILCASGTAVVGNLSFMLDLESVGIFGPPFKPVISGSVMRTKSDAGYFPTPGSESGLSPPLSSSLEGPTGPEGYTQRHQCSLVHIPYADISLPYAFRVIKCKSCARGPVPDVLFCTVEPPPNLEITGRGCLMQATVVRLKKDLKAENNAREVSDALPFVEYEIHRQLLNKMRVKGMNALFGLKVNIDLNDRTIVAVATATGFFVAALPSPRPPKLQQARGGDDQYLQKMQLRLEGKFAENLKYYGIERSPKTSLDSTNGSAQSEANEDSDTDLDTEGHEADLASGNKDTCVLEIDDSEDVDILDSLMEYYPPPWIQVMSTEEIVGISPGHIVKCCQTFTQLVQQKISPTSRELSTACRKLMSSLYFKLRRMKPCILCSINFRAELNEENELLMAIYGSVICLSHDGKTREELAKELESLDFEDTSSVKSNPVDQQSNAKKSETYQSAFKTSGRNYFYSDTKDGQHTINLTPLSYVPGAKIEKYLGSLNFFLIRETSGLREAGGINSFVQSFICEIYSIVRSHVSALGGNALVSFFISDLVVMPSLNKNQAQCLVHAGGDAVQISYLPPIEANAKT